jgi:hypothetical protein
MSRLLMPLALVTLLSGCACCDWCKGHLNPDGSPRECYGCCPMPPLNCRGMPYDGGGFSFYRPRGPFWCRGPGPCSRANDPTSYCYEVSCNPEWTQRPVCHDYDAMVVGMPYGFAHPARPSTGMPKAPVTDAAPPAPEDDDE